MKIGIFTFHDEYNYGSALQAFALQSYLKSLGHEVRVLHHHLSVTDERIKGIFASHSLRDWLRFVVLGMLGGGQFARQWRLRKSRAFVRKYLQLTKYRFYTWEDAPQDLGVDILIVGSDQLWSCQWESPAKYLLYDAPNIPAIAYAVSMGVSEVPIEMRKIYKNGFKRFKRISVREEKAIELMRKCGFEGEVVQTVDPTLLADTAIWDEFIGKRLECVPYLFCYLMGEDVESALPILANFAKEKACGIRIVVEKFYWNNEPLRISCLIRALHKCFRLQRYCKENHIEILLSASHKDFIRNISMANWVLTDSFHALMFSLVFKKDVRVLRPRNEYRERMFSRLEDASRQFMETEIICNNLEEALSSFLHNEKSRMDQTALNCAVNFSKEWLISSLANTGSGNSNGK